MASGSPSVIQSQTIAKQASDAKSYLATAYCCDFGKGKINGTGVTSGGTNLTDCKQHYVIAAGVGSGLTIGDVVRIDPDPLGQASNWKVDDHGGAIIGRHIDIYIADCAKAKQWGKRNVKVWKVDSGAATGPTSTDASVSDIPGVSQVLDTATAVHDLANSLEKFFQTLFSSATWFRIGKVLVGVGLGLIAVVVLVRPAIPTIPKKAS